MEKTRKNHQPVLNNTKFIDLIYKDGHKKLVVDEIGWFDKFSDNCELYELENEYTAELPFVGSEEEFLAHCRKEWVTPEEYKVDLEPILLAKCNTQEEIDRVKYELDLFRSYDMIHILQFLRYFIDTMEENNILWGTGRGSSCASFCLFLLGVHLVDPIKYNIDIKEFLR